MADVIFYEKPGCAGNARQRRLLEEAGHRLDVRDLLTAPWTADSLRPFFGTAPVAEWFNRSAPAVKAGEVVPESLDADAALAVLTERPLLIRRPLMQVGDERRCGFDADAVNAWIGLAPGSASGNLEGCARPDMPPCPTPAPMAAPTPAKA